MNVKVFPSVARGSVAAPPSKSMAHRLLICAAMAAGTSRLHGVSQCEDALATIDCLRALGATCTWEGEDVTVTGADLLCPPADRKLILPCRESGSTLRFLLPMALLSGREATLVGADSLLRRPMAVYEEICREKGLFYSADHNGIAVRGPLSAGEYTLAGNVSSQFVSGLLFALSVTRGVSRIRILPPIESRSYILLTLSALSRFGARVEWLDDTTLRIEGRKTLDACDCTVEGDYSNAAFLEAFNLFGGDVRVTGLEPASLQGDRVYRDCFSRLARENTTVSLQDCPDLAPILFSIAAAKHGGVFTDTARLRIKESDRAEVMAQELRKLGARISVYENRVEILPSTLHPPTEPIDGHNDHRVVMSLAVLLSVFGGEIRGAEAAAKSFPDFFERIASIGIRTENNDK
ncbi:MAG: 3-phosphoshikimate 1-carboxyvinyltransferase [Clostridia bacterium]|nr:3-phosphoshikimate 1-carboxyvinyltransferase [Clostridia bacterium]